MPQKRSKRKRGRRKSDALSAKSNEGGHRFGGRATASGVGYESRVAALVAVQMLAGEMEKVWDWASGNEIRTITLQARQPVDDFIIERIGNTPARAFIQAKDWGAALALSPTSKVFSQTISGFVRQFLQLGTAERTSCLLVWAVSSRMGSALTRDLHDILISHRANAPDGSLREFVHSRNERQQTVFKSLIQTVRTAWRKNAKSLPKEEELRDFLRALHVEVHDFGRSQHDERTALRIIRQNVASLPSDDQKIWEKLESIFFKADEKGLTLSTASLRHDLSQSGFALKTASSYANDIAVLQQLTRQNLARLRNHSILRFGQLPEQDIHIQRLAEQTHFVAAMREGHRLLTGEPGCGKSGLIHDAVEVLLSENCPVVLLLAEEIFHAGEGNENIFGLTHKLDDVLAHWPNGMQGVLVTDALDAIRDTETLKRLRLLLHEVLDGESGWRLAASVREFDLKHGRELKDLFPGQGFPGNENPDFAGVAHFHLNGLRDDEIAWLKVQRPQIGPFIESANLNPKSRGLQRSPFYLRLAAELLSSGVSPARLADWNSPALLLRSFWERRLEEGTSADDDKAALRKICQRMVLIKNPTISAKEISLSGQDQKAIRNLRSKGILQSHATLHGVNVGTEAIRFSHHLLHDYAIARTLIPALPEQFCAFASGDPLLPVFYRQSFFFALEEIWDADVTRETYWKTAILLQSTPALHGITRITAPILAAKRVEIFGDLKPLFDRINATDMALGSEAALTLQHLASGLQDAEPAAIRVGADAWCAFVVQLSQLLDTHRAVEAPLVHLLARLDASDVALTDSAKLNLNIASRILLGFHLKKTVNTGWIYLAIVAIESICHTFGIAPVDSEKLLLEMMADGRVSQFPQEELFRLAQQIQHLGQGGDKVVLRLIECAFDFQPEPGQWQPFGTVIMPMRIQSRDQWHSIQFSLANFFVTLNGENEKFVTAAVCLVANSRAETTEGPRNRLPAPFATIRFRGRNCNLVEDFSSYLSRGRYSTRPEEDRIIGHFETLLHGWAERSDAAKINAMLDTFAERNKTARLWTVLFNLGASHPNTLGYFFLPILDEPMFFTCRDYAHAATRLLGALHAQSDPSTREKLEGLILQLPMIAPLGPGESRSAVRPRLEHAQNRLLGVLEASNIALPAARELFAARHAADEIVPNSPPEGIEVVSRHYTEEELLAHRGIRLEDSVNRKLLELNKLLKESFPDDKAKLNSKHVAARWREIQDAERMVNRHGRTHKEAASELWGQLAIACRNIVAHLQWPKNSKRWLLIRRIALRAANDPLPRDDDGDTDSNSSWPSWGFPSPRIEAAHALPMIVFRRGRIDTSIERALRKLSRDKSYPVRFHFAENLTPLWERAPVLMWKIFDSIIAEEKTFSVLERLVASLDWLSVNHAEEALPRIFAIAELASNGAKADHHIHQQLSVTLVFRLIRTGDARCERYVNSLITSCDTETGHNALTSVLHNLRIGGWLITGLPIERNQDSDLIRARSWEFLLKLATTAQSKTEQHLRHWRESGPLEGDALSAHQASLGAAMRTTGNIASQLYFLSDAFKERAVGNSSGEQRLDPQQLKRFWVEAEPVFRVLVKSQHPHTAYELVQTLNHIMPCAPRDIFLLAAQAIQSSSSFGFNQDSLAVSEVVKLIQHALADFRNLFQVQNGSTSECLKALLAVLDLFVEVGWPQARQLTHRLEEIYR